MLKSSGSDKVIPMDKDLEKARELFQEKGFYVLIHTTESGFSMIISENDKAYTEMMSRFEESTKSLLGVDEVTLKYLQNTSPEEREKLRKVARISHLEEEIKILKSQI